jgi:hypothetical protein
MTTSTQTRGHCQCCGRLQAAHGTVAPHGYTVANGWFEGSCTGHHYAPIESSREQADRIIADVRERVLAVRARRAEVLAGTHTPATVRTTRGVDIPFADAEAWVQRDAVQALAYRLQRRAELGTAFANGHEELANRVHGQPLQTVARPAAAAPILVGETRVLGNRNVTAREVSGARVYWRDARGFGSWTGTQAWRKLAVV